MHLTWFLELWYCQSLVSVNDSACMKPICEVMQLKFYFGHGAHMDMEMLGRGLEIARRWTVSDEKST